jgi:Cu(I)/Ag(I) efflux system membrane fusion protein
MKLTSARGTASFSDMQFAGVRLYKTARTSGARRFRTLGRVSPIQSRIYRLSTGSEGWVRHVYPVSTGSLVKKDQPLASFYGREFIASQQSFFYALSSEDRERQAPSTASQQEVIRAQVDQTRETLEALGMNSFQIDEIAPTRVAAKDVVLSAPLEGIILGSDALSGQRFEKHHELYRIADLRRVWVIADLYEREAQFIRAGQKARISVPGSRVSVHATVGDTLSQFDRAEGVLKLRLETDNPGLMLRPDMLADVEIVIDLPPSLAVPDEAVVETGHSKVVFVAGGGRFTPREVETGWRMDGQTQITRGLEAGDKVALGANFLVDADTRLSPGHD